MLGVIRAWIKWEKAEEEGRYNRPVIIIEMKRVAMSNISAELKYLFHYKWNVNVHFIH